jgi:long-chain fatty acid transport protein
LGITAPYGLGNVWDYDSGAFADPLGLRYASPYSAELKTVNFNPTFSLQMGERLRFGAGLDVMYSDLTFKQFYPWAAVTGQPADGEGKAQARGDGAGVGMNVGLTWEFIDRHRLAITYRSAIDVDYDGHFRVKDAPALFGGGTYSTSFRSHIQFPSILGLGYGVELTDTLRLEVDFEWLKFSNFQNLPIDIAQPLPGLPSNVPENWRDTFTVGFGGDWRFASNWVLRAGYQFYQSPVPDSTFSPSIPDANQNVITIGVGAQFGRHSFEAAYGYDFYDERRITNNQNPAFNGNYDITVHLISFAYRFRF